MRIIFAGTPKLAVETLKALVESGHEVVGVITRCDARVGRKRVLTPSPVSQYAKSLGIEVINANTLNSNAEEWIASKKADLGVVVAYGALLTNKHLEATSLGWINLHFSLLPRWRGAAPVQRALMNGETKLGVSVFRLDEGLDSGKILTTTEIEVPLGTTSGVALEKLAEIGSLEVIEAIGILNVDPDAGYEQLGETCYASKLSREDGKMKFLESTREALARWAGVTPEPGAWALSGNETLKIISVIQSDSIVDIPPGSLQLISNKAYLGFADGVLEVTAVQPAGKKVMKATDWLRGLNGSVQLS